MNAPLANVPRVELEIVRGQARRKQRPVNVPAFLIGASRDCDLVLGDTRFGEVHAYLIVHAGGVSVRHLGLGPQLFVNDLEVRRSPLRNGDRLRTGPYEFIVHVTALESVDRGPLLMNALPTATWTSVPPEHNSHGLKAAFELLNDIRSALNGAVALRQPA